MEMLQNILISPVITIRQSLKQMDLAGEKILFVVDGASRILGVVTDGNIRRWILRGGPLNEPISKAMTRNPIALKEGYAVHDAKELMLKKQIECIPIVDDDGRILSAIRWRDLFGVKTQNHPRVGLPVVLMAGGEGTRLSPFTKVLPKPLMLIGDKPILEHIMDRFSKYDCNRFYLSVNYKANIIKAYFDDFNHPFSIKYVKEKTPLGTAGSLRLLNKKISTTFFVSNCDILIDADFADIVKFHKLHRNSITMIGSMKHYTIPYGVCCLGKNGVLNSMKEKPEYDYLVNTGMYVLEPEVLDDIPANGPYHMTDLINAARKKGRKIGVYPISEKSWMDIGQLEELKDTLKRLGVDKQ